MRHVLPGCRWHQGAARCTSRLEGRTAPSSFARSRWSSEFLSKGCEFDLSVGVLVRGDPVSWNRRGIRVETKRRRRPYVTEPVVLERTFTVPLAQDRASRWILQVACLQRATGIVADKHRVARRVSVLPTV